MKPVGTHWAGCFFMFLLCNLQVGFVRVVLRVQHQGLFKVGDCLWILVHSCQSQTAATETMKGKLLMINLQTEADQICAEVR